MQEIAPGKLRSHICESRGSIKAPSGWTTGRLLQCLSKNCGNCGGCGLNPVLPSHKFKPVSVEIDFTKESAQTGLSFKQDVEGAEAKLVKIMEVQNEDIRGWVHSGMHVEQIGDTPVADLSTGDVETLLQEAMSPYTVKFCLRDAHAICNEDSDKLQVQVIMDKMMEVIRTQQEQIAVQRKFHDDLTALTDTSGSTPLAGKSDEEMVAKVKTLVEHNCAKAATDDVKAGLETMRYDLGGKDDAHMVGMSDDDMISTIQEMANFFALKADVMEFVATAPNPAAVKSGGTEHLEDPVKVKDADVAAEIETLALDGEVDMVAFVIDALKFRQDMTLACSVTKSDDGTPVRTTEEMSLKLTSLIALGIGLDNISCGPKQTKPLSKMIVDDKVAKIAEAIAIHAGLENEAYLSSMSREKKVTALKESLLLFAAAKAGCTKGAREG